MIYLAEKILFFLILALVAGIVIGWFWRALRVKLELQEVEGKNATLQHSLDKVKQAVNDCEAQVKSATSTEMT